MKVEFGRILYLLRHHKTLLLGIILIFSSNGLSANNEPGIKFNFQTIDTIPNVVEDSIPGIIYKELIDTIVTFNPDTFEETVELVKRVVADTVSNLNSQPAQTQFFQIVERLPRFPGCEHLGTGMTEVEECARHELIRFVYENLEYPEIAKKNGIEGKVIVQFTVDKKGYVSGVNVVQDIGSEEPAISKSISKAAISVIEKMNPMDKRWIPGIQRGEYVDFKYSLPIYFTKSKF
jgi:TonB family protein